MRTVIALFILTAAWPAWGQNPQNAEAQKRWYNLGADIQIGYPSVKLKNPDESEAIYDGIAVRGTLNIPIIRSTKFDVYLSPSVKYMDLENLANDESQYESANVVGAGGGLTFRYKNLMFGGRYMHLWARHFATGAFSDRANYHFETTEAFAGLYFQFDRLGLGLTYTRTVSEIPAGETGLQGPTPYDESIYSVQGTFDMGDSLWGILKSLF